MMAHAIEHQAGARAMRSCKVVLASGLVLLTDSMLADRSSLSGSALIDASPKFRVNAKRHLDAAKTAKKDEFYTQYKDIKREVDLYVADNPNVFRDKVILFPCDDPAKSNFVKYFTDNAVKFGWRRLVCTCYNRNGQGSLLTLEQDDLINGALDYASLAVLSLKGDGDFRSEEIKAIRDASDIIITNPPFSLFRQFFTWLIESDKQFLIIGNVNCISYKEVYPHIMGNAVWLGHGIGRWISGFIVPAEYDLYGTEVCIDEFGNRIVASNNCLWLTNLDHKRRHEPLKLMTMKENIERSAHKDIRNVGYRKYDNCDAIEVPYSDSIPSDYDGLMGVPITFLDKYCPEQFELVRFRKGDDGKDLRLDGKPPYFRILIRRRQKIHEPRKLKRRRKDG